MRTKTMLLSALLGTLGSVSLLAQSTNVYSLNAVGYINVTVTPGFNMIACPLVCSPDNTLNTLMNNAGNTYKTVTIYQWLSSGSYTNDSGSVALSTYTNGWVNGGFIALNPGTAAWFFNPNATNMTLTFVGTVPQGSLTNTLTPGFNMASSIVPTSGDLVTNGITLLTSQAKHDTIYTWDNINHAYDGFSWTPANGWISTIAGLTDPIVTNVGEGFWYLVAGATSENWVENFSVNP
jgi:hypothetical protein